MKKEMPAWLKLALIALAAGLLLGFTNELTAPAIAAQTELQAQEARRTVLPQAESFEELPAPTGFDALYVGQSGGAAVGYVAQVTGKGYGGEIQVIMGVDATGVITGISVGGPNFSETMGLGAKVRDEAFTSQFEGLKGPVTLGGQAAAASGDEQNSATSSVTAALPDASEAGGSVDAVTSATISSRAVINAVNTIYEYLQTLLAN